MLQKNKYPIRLTRSGAVKLIIGLLIFVNFLPLSKAQAGNLMLSPNTGTYTQGQSFSISINAASADQAMNASGGTLSFPSDKLQVTSLNKSGSIISLWAQEPSFSNKNGTVNFEGIILNPGYKGGSGKIITINFKTIAAGVADIKFSSGSILANDGKGTNILQSLGTARFNIETKVDGPGAPSADTPPESIGAPAAPLISSTSHPDPNAWYNKTTAEFSWNVPSDVTGVRLLVSDKPQDIPTINYQTALKNKTVTDLGDGTWYLHVRLKNKLGWGGVSHFRFQVDTKKPKELKIKLLDSQCPGPPDDPSQKNQTALANNDCRSEFQSTARLALAASDDESGIKHYNIKIDDQELSPWVDSGDGIYITPSLRAGTHTIRIEAVDQAGNSTTDFLDFEIKAVEAPKITFFPATLHNNERLVIQGEFTPKGKLMVWLQKEAEEAQSFIINTNHIGRFTFVYSDQLSNGNYTFWVESLDEQGTVTSVSVKNHILISPTNFLRIGTIAIDILSIIIPIVALLILLVILLICSRRKIKGLNCSINTRVNRADDYLHHEIINIKKKIAEHIKILEKVNATRDLTPEEKILIKNFSSTLDKTEETISEKIQNIKKVTKTKKRVSRKKGESKLLKMPIASVPKYKSSRSGLKKVF